MKTSFKAVRAALVAALVFMVGFAAEAQRVRLLQLERYLGQPIPNRAGYVGLTDTLGDQYYHKLDSIIGYIADSISQGLDTDEQYFDTAMIVNDTLILSIIRDGLPAHRISLTAYTSDDQTLSYDHATNTLSISGGNSVTNFEQAWRRQADLLHPISDGESIIRSGYTTFGWNGASLATSFDEVPLRSWGESRIDWLGFTSSKPSAGQHRWFEVNELSNLLYLSNKRFYATHNGAQITTGGAEILFNGEFGTPFQMVSNSTEIIEIDFTQGLEKLSSAGITYPKGYVYVSFYYVYNDATITVEGIYNGGGTVNYSASEKNIAINSHLGYKVLRYFIADGSYLTKIRLTFATGPSLCWPTEISYVQTSYYNEIEEPFLNKAVDNKLHTKLTFRDKVGDRQADNGTWGQILMSKVDSVEWADFTAIPGIYTYITNIADSVDTDTDTDEQTIDSFAITDDTLRISLSNDPDIFFVDLKTYIDTATSGYDTDSQSVNQFYLDGTDSLHIEITRGNHQSVYLGSLVPAAGSDKQRIDTFEIVDNILRNSLQRDSVNFSWVDLSPYLDNTDDQKIDVFTFVGTTLSVSNEDDGEASKTVDLSSLVDNWFINGLDDAFGSTDIGDAETVTFDGTGGITAKLSFDGSNTMVIDGSGLQWILQAQSGTSQIIGDAASEIVEIVGSGNVSTSISGNTVTINVPADVDNYVDGATYSGATADLTLTRTGALGDLVVNIMDHDWYEVGTTRPPDDITDEMFHTGKTGIGMNPVWLLDVSEDARINGHQIGTGPTIASHTNIRFGKDALEVNTGSYNLAIGGSALKSNDSGTNNIAIGYESLKSNNSSYNIGVGVESLYSNSTGSLMIGIGYQALRQNTTGIDNTAIGHGSQQHGTDASYNTSLGHETLYENIHGIENTAVGDYALRDDTLARKNIALGRFSLNLTNNANSNIGIGYYALHYSSGASYNIAIGDSAMHNSSTTAGLVDNIAMGKKALSGIVANSNDNIVIGKSGADLSGDNNSIYGNDNTVTGGVDNNVIIGDGQTMTTAGNIVITNGAGVLGFKMLSTGFVGIGEITPTQKLHVPGNVRITGAYYDSNNEPGTAGQVLASTITGTDWVDATSGGTMSYFFINGNDDAFGNTQVDQGEVITIDGTGGITASLASSGSLSYVIDGSGITGTTNLAITNSANPGLTSSTGSDVIFQDGTGIDAVYVNDFTVRFNAADSDPGNEIQSLGLAGTGTINLTLTGTSPGVYIAPGNAGITLSQGGSTMSISATDISASNEGYNGVGAGSSTSSTITTNTSGGNAITLQVAGSLSISESTNSNGGTITLTGTGGSGTVTSVGLTGTTGIGVTGSPITTSGTFTLSLNNDLQALEALASTGIAYRTGAATWTTYTATNLPTGLTTTTLLMTDASGTLADASGLTWNSVSGGSLNVVGSASVNTNLQVVGQSNLGYIHSSGAIYFDALPTFANEAAAGSLTSGRIYKSSDGIVRVKL